MDAGATGLVGDVSLELQLRDLIPRGYRLACGMLHDPGRAEDAVQEAALKAWRKQSQFQSGTDLQAWFLAIVANECRSARRHRWLSVLSLEHRDSAARGVDEEVLRGEDLRRALLALPDKDRLVVVLRFYLDLPLEEVAKVAGLTITAARGRLYRSIKRLRPGLELQEGL
jgi:RNA polymerase sigma-70 factor (ECF subfamily)